MATVEVELRSVESGEEANANRKNDLRTMEDLQYFVPLFTVTQVVGLLLVVLVFYWSVTYLGGFGLTGSSEFSWHPLLMTIGFIYLGGNALLVFRAFRNLHKNTLKWAHAILNGVAFLFVLLSTIAVFDYHNQSNIANLYSLHSWIGIVGVVAYLFQGVVGFSAFLLPGFSGPIRSLLMPYHVYFGQFIFAIGIASAISGINEKLIFKLGSTDYQKLPPEAVLMNIAGILFLIFGGFVIYLSTNAYYKRQPRPEDGVLLNNRSPQ